MITPRQVITALSVKYKGDWRAIRKAVLEHENMKDEEVLRLLKTIKSNYVTIYDDDYPRALIQHCPQTPYVLYYYGDIKIAGNQEKILTVVGSREPSDYAAVKTAELCGEIAAKGIVICSGLARGIDAIAGDASCRYPGKSIAVLGCGIDRVYPLENTGLRNTIAKNGLLLSEYPGNLAPEPRFFPTRNRILACLAQACFIVEGREHSGTMVTASYAAEFSRDVGVLPFRADEGYINNTLIKFGAAVIEDASDLELLMETRKPM